MKSKKTLRQKIRDYRRKKWLAAPPLIAAGLVGVALPIIPGLPLLATGVALISPISPSSRTKKT